MVGSSTWEVSVMIEQTITIGNIVEISSILGGGLVVFITLKSTVTNLKEDVALLQIEIKKLSDVITRMAVTDIRLTNLEQDIRELRHGHGWITGPTGIDREYP